MRKKRAKKKPNVDYRYRWPTQQTLVESRASMETSTSERRWKSYIRQFRQLRRKSSPGPGKSTHPYDTGIGERESDSELNSGSALEAAEVRGDGRTCLKKLIRTSFTSSSLAPTSKFSHTREKSRPETPKTPIQPLRVFVHPPPPPLRNSPFSRSRTVTPADPDKPAVQSTRSRAHVPPAPPPAQAGRPVTMNPRLSWGSRLRNFVQSLFRRRSLDWQRAASS
ncbi:hypothetical protein F5B17DRAFT_397279 [Nemania serpens]|nr:hypothetical protein F5B17DRAFT_397279 [Nemania serpens]